MQARDRTLGSGQIPIEICVMKQARDTAWLYNMMDRGTLEPGKKADLNGASDGVFGSVRAVFQIRICEPCCFWFCPLCFSSKSSNHAESHL